jgi:hypothetical protein
MIQAWWGITSNERGWRIFKLTVCIISSCPARAGIDDLSACRSIGEDGGLFDMSGFGKSGPEDELFAHSGISPERVAAAVPIGLDS